VVDALDCILGREREAAGEDMAAVCFEQSPGRSICCTKKRTRASPGAPEEGKGDRRRRRGSCSRTVSESCEEARRSAGVRREILSHRVNDLEREQRENREEGLGYL
jgi:hypothetical protein